MRELILSVEKFGSLSSTHTPSSVRNFITQCRSKLRQPLISNLAQEFIPRSMIGEFSLPSFPRRHRLLHRQNASSGQKEIVGVLGYDPVKGQDLLREVALIEGQDHLRIPVNRRY